MAVNIVRKKGWYRIRVQQKKSTVIFIGKSISDALYGYQQSLVQTPCQCFFCTITRRPDWQ